MKTFTVFNIYMKKIHYSELNLFLFFPFSSFPFPYRWLPIAKLVNIPDINMVMATIAATFMDNNREQLV